MKKTLSLILVFVSIILLLFGCEKKYRDPYADVQKKGIEIDGQKDVLLEWDKKYEYDGRNIVLLWLENNSESVYTVDITCEFADGEGREVSTVGKKFSGFSTGCRNCFVFDPGTSFETYSYTIDAVLYNGETRLEFFQPSPECKVIFKADPLAEYSEGDVKLAVIYQYEINNTGKTTFEYDADLVVFDNNGRIFDIHSLEGTLTPGKHGNSTMTVYADRLWEEGIETPDDLKNDVEIVFALNSLK